MPKNSTVTQFCQLARRGPVIMFTVCMLIVVIIRIHVIVCDYCLP